MILFCLHFFLYRFCCLFNFVRNLFASFFYFFNAFTHFLFCSILHFAFDRFFIFVICFLLYLVMNVTTLSFSIWILTVILHINFTTLAFVLAFSFLMIFYIWYFWWLFSRGLDLLIDLYFCIRILLFFILGFISFNWFLWFFCCIFLYSEFFNTYLWLSYFFLFLALLFSFLLWNICNSCLIREFNSFVGRSGEIS